MNIEDNIFQRHTPNPDKLLQYGFKQLNGGYTIEKLFKDSTFKVKIALTPEGKVEGDVFDLENDDKFLPLRVEGAQGAFVGEVRSAYEALLKDIRDNCFSRKYYMFSQSNRITNLIIEKYGDEPEFLWDKFKGSGIFRNPKTKKWYAAILDVQRDKIQPQRSGVVEVLDIKLSQDEIKQKLKEPNFYAGYHMNKKYWLTIILDETVSDDEIMALIDKSYCLSGKK